MKTEKYRFGEYITEIYYTADPDVRELADSRSLLFIFDEMTAKLYGPAGRLYAVVPRGETSKSLRSVEAIIDTAIDGGLGRDSVFIGVGGGIVCDVSAFAASVYMRGCRLILYPTTLLAMVDASIGGKTGCNFRGYKNMIGTFYPAEKIVIDPSVLQTLPRNELRAGMAENIKHACLGGEDLFHLLEEGRESILGKDLDTVSEMIRRSIEVKAGIVEKDLTETGIRAHLNFGHTFAHALESIENMEGSGHGEAVAWGVAMAVNTGLKLGITDKGYAGRVISLLTSYGYRLDRNVDVELFLQAIKQDKKKRSGKVRFVLQRNLGETFVSEVDEEILRQVIADQRR